MANTNVVALLNAVLFAVGPTVNEKREELFEGFANGLVDQVESSETEFDNVGFDLVCDTLEDLSGAFTKAKMTHGARLLAANEASAAAAVDAVSASGVAAAPVA